MTDKTIAEFQKLFILVFTDNRNDKAKENGYYQLERLIKARNEAEIEIYLQEYMKMFARYVDDTRSSRIFRLLIFRKLETISDIDKLDIFAKEISDDTSIRRRIREIMAREDSSDQQLKEMETEIHNSIGIARYVLTNRKAERTTAQSNEPEDMLTTIRNSYLQSRGKKASTIKDLLDYEPKFEAKSIPEYYIQAIEQWQGLKDENEVYSKKNKTKPEEWQYLYGNPTGKIYLALKQHRKWSQDNSGEELLYFKILKWFRDNKKLYDDINIEFYFQIISSLIYNRKAKGKQILAFNKQEEEFFLGPLKSTKALYFRNFLNRFDEFFRDSAKVQDYMENFDRAAYDYIILIKIGNSRKSELVPDDKKESILKDIKELSEVYDKLKTAVKLGDDVNITMSSQVDYYVAQVYYFNSSSYALANRIFRVGEKINSAKGEFIIIGLPGVKSYSKNYLMDSILIMYTDVKDIFFSISLGEFENRVLEHAFRGFREAMIATLHDFAQMNLIFLSLGSSFITSGIGRVIFDIAVDTGVAYAVRNHLLNPYVGMIIQYGSGFVPTPRFSAAGINRPTDPRAILNTATSAEDKAILNTATSADEGTVSAKRYDMETGHPSSPTKEGEIEDSDFFSSSREYARQFESAVAEVMGDLKPEQAARLKESMLEAKKISTEAYEKWPGGLLGMDTKKRTGVSLADDPRSTIASQDTDRTLVNPVNRGIPQNTSSFPMSQIETENISIIQRDHIDETNGKTLSYGTLKAAVKDAKYVTSSRAIERGKRQPDVHLKNGGVREVTSYDGDFTNVNLPKNIAVKLADKSSQLKRTLGTKEIYLEIQSDGATPKKIREVMSLIQKNYSTDLKGVRLVVFDIDGIMIWRGVFS